MVKTIGEVQRRAKQRLLPAMQRLLQRLRDNTVELVCVHLDGGQPVTWLWCCSEPPGDQVGHFASFVCREFSQAVPSFRSLNVDSDQLKRDFRKRIYLWAFSDYFIRRISVALRTTELFS